MLAWTSFERQMLLSEESRPRFDAARKKPARFDDELELRGALLDFVADFANWDNSIVPEYLATARALTATAHKALGGAAGSRPLVVDPFAGGGSIPLSTALRIVPNASKKSVTFEIIQNASSKNVGEGTIRRGAVTCPCCGFSTPVTSVRKQLRMRKGGAAHARLVAVRYDHLASGERTWRLAEANRHSKAGSLRQQL